MVSPVKLSRVNIWKTKRYLITEVFTYIVWEKFHKKKEVDIEKNSCLVRTDTRRKSWTKEIEEKVEVSFLSK